MTTTSLGDGITPADPTGFRNAVESDAAGSSVARSSRPLIALTMGDAAGIGPEVIVRTADELTVKDACDLVVIGHPEVFQRAIELTGSRLKVRSIVSLADARRTVTGHVESVRSDAALADRILPVFNPCDPDVVDVSPGVIDGRAGRAAWQCLVTAANAALAGDIDAITTAPLNKAALKAAGLDYPGHTEILGEVCGVTDFGMMLYLAPGDVVRGPNGLGVVHETLHTSIRSVPGLLTTGGIAARIRLMDRFLKRIGCQVPRVAVCALNPHAGEGGLFGDEEARIIAPAVEDCRAAGMHVAGPLPADTLLRRAVHGEFDGVVAMYHDQGHIALKLIGFDSAANITLGLPIVRTSPSHGTAFDIAWQGRASAVGMIEAVRIAARLAATR